MDKTLPNSATPPASPPASPVRSPASRPIVYPQCDGLPMAENTLPYEYIVTIKEGLEVEFRDEDVFVAADLFWYPVEGRPDICLAPDVLVALGRPKGHRPSYLQWLEGNIIPQVVFEVLSPGNRAAAIVKKFKFYERYGVEEYHVYDPDEGALSGWLRKDGELVEIADMKGWISPRLKIRFELENGDLRLFGREGRRFLTPQETARLLEEEQQARRQAQQRAERLAEQLRALGIDPQSD